MQVLRKSTAATVVVGPVLDIAGLPVVNASIGDFNISKGGVSTSLGFPTSSGHSHNGHYILTLTEDDTDTVGHLTLTSSNFNHAMPPGRFQVIERSVYDAVYGVGAMGGLGAWTVKIRAVIDGQPVSGAMVRLTSQLNSWAIPTNELGEVYFNLDDGIYQVAITGTGFTFAGQTLEVTDDTEVEYELSPINIYVSDPDKITGYWLCLDENAEIEVGVSVYMQLETLARNSTGLALDSEIRTEISDIDGVVRFYNLLPGCGYSVWRGGGPKYKVNIPNSANGPIQLRSLIGKESE